MRLVAGIALCMAQAACFSPKESDGAVACGSAGECPPGFTCGGDDRCHRDPVDGPDAPVGGPDAPVVDAPPGIDAAPIPDGPDIDAGEFPACDDGIDNDCDGIADYPGDTGCGSALDTDEHHIPAAPGSKACDDGIDNDDDGFTDYRAVTGCGDTDPGCTSSTDPSE